MGLIQIYEKFKDKTGRQINADEKDFIINYLQSLVEITDENEAQMFLSLLKICRTSQSEMNGKGMMDAITTVFSGGDEGAYYKSDNTNSYINDRFMYELIQNVDDCQYSDISDCKLDIFFDIRRDKIVLKYNELGFKPKNVVAISDLGNSTKNHKKSKNFKESNLDKTDFQEIGEKGIGFKSIFGLANKVTIKSGYFYFSFYRDNVLIPEIENYDGFTAIEGTELHLYLDEGCTKELYEALKAKYHNQSAIMNENPVLFLNKLSEITYSTYKDFFGFYVTRNQNSENGSEIELKFMSSVQKENKTIKCYRFVKEIVYSVEECRSRYGEDECEERKHKIEIIAATDMKEKTNGRIYSFFPTEQSLDAPIIVQAPFKLNSARTNIASEKSNGKKNNLWYKKTKLETIDFVHDTYERLAKLLNEDIVDFIPQKNLVLSHKCALYDDKLSVDNIICLRLFPTTTGKYLPYSKVCYLQKNDVSLNDAKAIHKLLNINVELLNSINYDKFQRFNIQCITNIEQSLFILALNNSDKTHECLKFIRDYNPKPLDIVQKFYINLDQANEFIKCAKLKKFINNETIKAIKIQPSMNIYLRENFSELKELDDLKSYCLNNCSQHENDFKEYINQIHYVKSNNNYSDIIFCNCIIGNHVLDSLSSIYQALYPESRGDFFAFLKADEVEKKILKLTDANSVDDIKYFYELKRLREYQKKALGKQYDSILKIIKNSGTKSKRFFSEILQNIDDCKFVGDPRASIKISKTEMTVSYNEVGFTRGDIISITAIGESTKRMIKEDVTGEKGIGFKSIFNVVDWVEIHSGNFHFKVFKDSPTIPIIIENCPKIAGTTMIYHFSDDAISELLTHESFILKNCLCLKRLKNINFNKEKLEILDKNSTRILKLGDMELKFYKFTYVYNVDNQRALQARYENKLVEEEQKIYYYVPSENMTKLNNQYCIYSTFPTETEIAVPLYVDANLNLNTSRENLLEDDVWNEYTFQHIYNGYFKLLEHMKDRNYKLMLNLFPYDHKFLFYSKLAKINVFNRINSMDIFKIFNLDKFTNLYMGIFSENLEYYVLNKWGRNAGNQNVHYKNNLIDFDLNNLKYLENECKINHYSKRQLLLDLKNSKIYNAITEQKLSDKTFRDELYNLLVSTKLDYNYYEDRESNLKNWSIIPVKKNNEEQYICYNENIYYDRKNLNNYPAEISILNTRIMSVETFDNIFTDKRILAYTADTVSFEFYKEIKNCFKYYKFERAKALLNLYNTKTDLFLSCLAKKKDFEYDEILLETKSGTVINFNSCFIDIDNKDKGCLNTILVKDEYVDFAKSLGVKPISKISKIENLFLTFDRNHIIDFLNISNSIENESIYKQILNKKIEEEDFQTIRDFVFFDLLNKIGMDKAKDILTKKEEIFIDINGYCIEKYGQMINELFKKTPSVMFRLNKDIEFSNLKDTGIINEIKEELSLRKDSESIVNAKKLLNNCVYFEKMNTPMVALRKSNHNEILIINKKIYSEYDILENLKKYFFNNFRLIIDINREITKYTRDNYESIISTEFNHKVEQIVTENAKWLSLDDVEAVKDFMCKPIKTQYGVYGGYAKRCPLCGSIIHTELTGMRISDLKYEGYYLKLISCSNCHENLKYSKEIKVDLNKINDNKLSFECNINGYLWKVEDVQIRVGQKAILNVLNKK